MRLKIYAMSIFVRKSKRKLIASLLFLFVVFFTASSLLIVSVQELLDRSLYERIVSIRRENDLPRCPPLDAVAKELMRILGQWETISEEISGGKEGENRSNAMDQLLSVAVQTLTSNRLMLDKQNTEKLIYLGEVLLGFKEWLVTQEDGRSGDAEQDSRMDEDAILSLKIADLVKIFENFTKTETELGIDREIQQADPIRVYTINDDEEAVTWKLYHSEITQYSLYQGDSPTVDQLLHDIRTLPIKGLSPLNDDGTQMKLVFFLEDNSRVLFKPKRVPRDYVEPLDLYYMYEFERHTAEIAAFHLDRILGFHRVPPAAGRYIDMLEDIYDQGDEELQNTFYKSPIGNQCFFSICEYFCDPGHGVCGNRTTLEGSLASYLPSRDFAPRTHLRNPWSRSYSKFEEAEWETTDDGYGYCQSVREEEPWNDDHALLNIIDAHIFDFFAGNKDRHHLEVFDEYGNASYPILFDNGKGFGRAFDDITSILAPLYQCCLIRQSTLKRLLQLETGTEKLSELMRRSLSTDALPDILTEAHLESLDRRLRIILEQVHDCMLHSGPENVILHR